MPVVHPASVLCTTGPGPHDAQIVMNHIRSLLGQSNCYHLCLLAVRPLSTMCDTPRVLDCITGAQSPEGQRRQLMEADNRSRLSDLSISSLVVRHPHPTSPCLTTSTCLLPFTCSPIFCTCTYLHADDWLTMQRCAFPLPGPAFVNSPASSIMIYTRVQISLHCVLLHNTDLVQLDSRTQAGGIWDKLMSFVYSRCHSSATNCAGGDQWYGAGAGTCPASEGGCPTRLRPVLGPKLRRHAGDGSRRDSHPPGGLGSAGGGRHRATRSAAAQQRAQGVREAEDGPCCAPPTSLYCGVSHRSTLASHNAGLRRYGSMATTFVQLLRNCRHAVPDARTCHNGAGGMDCFNRA